MIWPDIKAWCEDFEGTFQKIHTMLCRILNKCIPLQGTDCWIWTGKRDGYGYGRIKIRGKQRQVHRIMFQLIEGPIDEREILCHSCDNRACVNPKHLRIGTHKDNATDRESRNRGVRVQGSDHPWAKLTEKKVLKIRASKVDPAKLATHYGVSVETIINIQQGKSWKHVED